MAETTDIGVETLLRQTLREEAATVAVRVTVDDVLVRRRVRRRGTRARGLRVLLVAALLTVPAAALVLTAAQPDGDPNRTLGDALTTPRAGHSATRLADGRVLLNGGTFGDGGPAAEIYDPQTDSFEAVGPMTWPRGAGSVTRLDDGRLLMVGGSSAALYDSEVGTFERTGDMVLARSGHAAVLLPDGRVAIIGGAPELDSEPTAVVEVFDPASGGFASLGVTLPALDLQAPEAVALDDGRVLVLGGRERGRHWKRGSPLVFDPNAGTVELLDPIRIGAHPAFEEVRPNAAVKLDDGRVLIVALHPESGDRSSLVTFDPDTGELEPVAEVAGAYRVYPVSPAPALLPDGRVVLMLGAPSSNLHTLVGDDEGAVGTPSPALMDPVFVFDPVSAEVALVTTVPARDRSSLTVLDDGDVLIAGGEVLPDRFSAEAWRLSVPDPTRDRSEDT